MLCLADKMHKLNFGKLMAVYEEENQKNGAQIFPDLPEGQQILQAEQNFYQYLREGFFTTPGAVYAVWQEKGQYTSALRLEPYEDGFLIAALETAPAYRRQGYGEKLICAVQEQFSKRLYSHVNRNNLPSLAIHKKCGFCQMLDYAKYLDGSVDRKAVTLRYR